MSCATRCNLKHWNYRASHCWEGIVNQSWAAEQMLPKIFTIAIFISIVCNSYCHRYSNHHCPCHSHCNFCHCCSHLLCHFDVKFVRELSWKVSWKCIEIIYPNVYSYVLFIFCNRWLCMRFIWKKLQIVLDCYLNGVFAKTEIRASMVLMTLSDGRREVALMLIGPTFNLPLIVPQHKRCCR